MTPKNRYLLTLAIVFILAVGGGVGGYFIFKQHVTERVTQQVMQKVREAEIEEQLASMEVRDFESIGKVSSSYVYTYKNFNANRAPSVHIMENLTLVLMDSGESFALNKEIHLVKPGAIVRKGIKDGIEYICLGSSKVSCSTVHDKKLIVAM